MHELMLDNGASVNTAPIRDSPWAAFGRAKKTKKYKERKNLFIDIFYTS